MACFPPMRETCQCGAQFEAGSRAALEDFRADHLSCRNWSANVSDIRLREECKKRGMGARHVPLSDFTHAEIMEEVSRRGLLVGLTLQLVKEGW